MAAAHDLDAALKDLIQRDAVVVPPYPAVAMRLQQLVASGAYGTYDVAKVAVTDPVVTGFLLRAANSAAVRGGAKIASVSEAVGRLGAAEVVRIALAVSLGAEAGRRGALASLRRRIWQEALASALISFHIASLRGSPAQETFVGALLHDVGRLVAVTCLEALLARSGDQRTLPEAEWMAVAERVHVELGMVTATKWGLPELLQTLIVAHHRPEKAGAHKAIVDIVRSADAVVTLLMTQPGISAEKLTAMAGLNQNEATRLAAAVPGIGAFVAGMEELSAAVPGADVISRVLAAVAPRAPVDRRREVGFPIRLVRTSGEVAGRCTGVTPVGLEVISKEKLPDKYLVRMVLSPPNLPAFDVHAFVERCQPVADGFEIEARLFALAGAAKDRWSELLASTMGTAAVPMRARA